MIHLFYLAAGLSRRYGAENKLLTNRDGRPLYHHGLDALTDAIRGRPDCTLTVVTSWPEITAAMREADIPCVPSPESHLGVSYTIRAALASLPALAEDDYLGFCVADQPYLTAATITRLLDSTVDRPRAVSLAAHDADGKTIPGNPVLFAAEFAPALAALEGDRGGRSILKRHPAACRYIFCDPRELCDIDTK